MGHNTSPNKRLYASWIFSNGPSALEFQIDFSNLALINRVYSGQASSINTDYPTSVKPRTLCVTKKYYSIMKKGLLCFFLLYSVLTFAQKVDTICFYRSGNLAFYLDTYEGWSHNINSAKSIGENAKIYPIIDSLKNRV